ncbi:GNAT family N-acetyltransferase [Streptomyces albus]|uniref:GNAT family N-acetyltransferase n=1 Tax=Streptomyces albus TaxID=1888 RepID=UPI0024AC8BA2|nr:GNAT family N-acetyltransferase [Streptomyces albus]MDI6407987.1 GNAT family N-acetyltransferase [Streptomyces albus]
MAQPVVVEVPQWEGSSSPTARRLADGARAVAALLPFPRVPVRCDERAGAGATVEGVRGLDVLADRLGAVREALATVTEPVTVTAGGDCGVELAPVERALRRHGDRLAVVWFDAHADLNIPASSPSGAFHGMVLRTLLGEGPEALRPRHVLTPDQVVLAGVRALDPAESEYVERHRVRRLTVTELAEPAALVEAVAATGAEAVYVHLDLDVLDPADFASVGVPEPGGLRPHRLADCVRALARRFPLAGLGITEHQPRPGAAAEDAVLDDLVRLLTDVLVRPAPDDVHRIEQHALAAWPSPAGQALDGWLVRHTPGMRRLRSGNTAWPRPEADKAAEEALPAVEEFYTARGLTPAVQVSPALHHIGLDERLAALGWRQEAAIHVMTAPAATVATAEPAAGKAAGKWAVRCDDGLTPAWLTAFGELDGQDDSRTLVDSVVSRIALPLACVTVRAEDGRLAGTGLFVGGDARWAGVYCMVTHPAFRRRGVAAAVLRTGARWAREQHIPGLYLQVSRTNNAARALYARAGFTHAYSYHYRLRGPAGER